MPLSNTTRSYGGIAKSFHWLTALLMFTVIPLGLIANNLAQQIQSPDFSGSQEVITRATLLFSLHKTIGVTLFFVALFRILWAFTQPKPGLLNADNKPEALAAETVHWLLYGSLVMVPLSGWIHHAATTGFAPIWWPLGQNLPLVPKSESVAGFFASIHIIMTRVLFVSLALHIAGALKHHVIDRDQTLRRMLPGANDAPQPPAQDHSLAPAGIAVVLWLAAMGAGAALGMFQAHGPAPQTAATPEAPAATSTAAAPETGNWAVSEGTLGIAVTQMGSKVSGSFARWSATIRFDDPATPGPAGSVDVTIDIASLTLGSVTGQAMGPDYFDSARFPTAQFTADLEKLETGYQASGTLQIRDKTVPLTLPFDLTIDGDTASMTGAVQVNRLDFDIGSGVKDEGSLAFAVDIDIALTATRAN